MRIWWMREVRSFTIFVILTWKIEINKIIINLWSKFDVFEVGKLKKNT